MALIKLRYFVFVAWLLAVSAGAVLYFNYESTPGAVGNTSSKWPAKTQIPFSTNLHTLVMFAHPKCPCTRASVEQLNRALAKYSEHLSTHVLFYRPSALDQEWTQSSSWDSASRIPGVNVIEDLDGEEARRFGAETSGYLVLYNPGGDLLFRGGITPGRGHAGTDTGVELIGAVLSKAVEAPKNTSVYGCDLLGECKVLAEGNGKQ